MNCHQHEFSLTSHPESRDRSAISSIQIHHDVSHPLTTAYAVHSTERSPEERKRRERDQAMARAKAITLRYGGGVQNLPVAHPVQQPLTATVTRVPPPRKGSKMLEPVFLALGSTFRKSSSSLLSSEEFLDNASCDKDGIPRGIPPPPALKTEVTTLLLSNQQPPADGTEEEKVSADHEPPVPRRSSDSIAYVSQLGEEYKGRSSFQAHDTITSTNPLVIPRRPTPTIYPQLDSDLLPEPMADTPNERDEHNEGGLLRGLAIDSQAQLLEQYQKQQQQPQHRPQQRTDQSTLAIQEQEQLWQQLSGHSGSPRSVTQVISPREEQALLWERLSNNLAASAANLSISRPVNAIEEQAQILETISRQRAPTTRLSAVEEQARMLMEFQSSRSGDPIEEQARRWQEIQDAKEQKVVEMVCQMSQALMEEVSDRQDEEELSFQYAIAASESEAQNNVNLEEAMMRVAVQMSQEGLEGVSIQRQLAAELACQTTHSRQELF
jgi:hypothetical protein